jgi:hypothetical protein
MDGLSIVDCVLIGVVRVVEVLVILPKSEEITQRIGDCTS